MMVVRAIRQASGLAMCILILGAVLVALLLVGPQAYANPAPDPDASTSIEIHKFDQPENLGTDANGLPQDTSGLTPVQGVTFTAKRIPDIDLTTNAGQQQAAALTLSEAVARVAETSDAATAVTDASGNASLTPLEVGLYLVQETNTPAGYVGAAPFVVALPMTHPQHADRWLDTVHVYPKNSKAAIQLDVRDQNAVKLGDTVRWASRSTIPNQSSLDGYLIEQILNEHLNLVGKNNLDEEINVSLDCATCSELLPGVHYTLAYSAQDHVLTVEFLPRGLRILEDAQTNHQTTGVIVKYNTTVRVEGVHINEAILYPSETAIQQRNGVNDTATTKWGPLSVVVHEKDDSSHLIPGARFQLYLTPADALAQRNPIVIDGAAEWVTDDQGRLIVNGLRFSDFVNGLDRETNDELFRTYWAAPTHVPDGWRWVDDSPLGGVVNSAVDYQTLIFLVERASQVPPEETPPTPIEPPSETPAPDPEDELSRTGAQIAGAIILAAVLLIGGFVLVSRARKARESGTDQ